MRKKLLVLVAAMVLFTACTENKSEGESKSSESVFSAATSVAFEKKETTADFTYTILNDTETALTESQSVAVASEITETSAEAIKNLVPVLTVKNIDSETNSLSWTEVEGAESYMLYLLNNETGEFEEYGEIKGTSCKDKNLTPNIKYTYAAAAVYADEKVGEMSESVSIYTYSNWIEKVQGDWIYYGKYDDTKTSVYRKKRDGSEKQLVCEYPEDVYFWGVTDKYIYFLKSEFVYDSDDYEYLQDSIIRTDLNGKNEKKMYSSTESYSIQKHEVYKNMLFYSYYGASMETDSGSYGLNVYDSNRDIAEGYHNIYDGIYHGISFVRDKNDVLYIMWLEEEIDREATENSEYGDIVTKKTGRIVLFNADTKEKTYINYIDDGSFDSASFLAYIDGKIYLRTDEGIIGYISEGQSFTSMDVSEFANHETVDTRNGDIFYEMNTYEKGLIVKNELFRLSEGESVKLVDLYFDNSGYLGQQYSLYSNYMIYINPDGKSVYYDLTTSEQIVLD